MCSFRQYIRTGTTCINKQTACGLKWRIEEGVAHFVAPKAGRAGGGGGECSKGDGTNLKRIREPQMPVKHSFTGASQAGDTAGHRREINCCMPARQSISAASLRVWVVLPPALPPQKQTPHKFNFTAINYASHVYRAANNFKKS
jgi:hypothetical protein